MRWLRVLGAILRAGLTIERTRLEPLVALRAAAGVAIVVGLFLWLVSPAYAASSALGAFSAGTATFQRSWRPRKVLALGAGAGLAISTFCGYVAAGHPVSFLLVLATWTFLAGMAWSAGPTAGIVSCATVAAMLVTVTLPTSVTEALEHAGVIAFGGLVQAALIWAFPIRRWGAHRDALADAFAALADFARRLRHDPEAPFDAEPMTTARDAATLTPSQARRRPAVLHGSRGLAERIRPVLATLADPEVGAPAEGPGRDRARDLLATAAGILDAAARAIRRGEPVNVPEHSVEALRRDTRGPDPAAGDGEARDSGYAEYASYAGYDGDFDPGALDGSALRAARRLADLLEQAVEIADSGDALAPTRAGGSQGDGGPLRRPTMLRLVPVLHRAFRRELRRDSTVLRHALRLAAVACAGYGIGTVVSPDHGYWVPITAVMVMRPDFHQTYARAVARLAGTAVGVGLATATVQLAHPGSWVTGALAVVAAGLTYLLMRTGYAASQCFTAAYVVFLLGLGGETWQETAGDRVLLTLLGGAMAMTAYALFPAWETPRILDRLADRLAGTGRYAATVVRGYAEPATESRSEVHDALLAGRAADAAWNEAFLRAKQEPVLHPGLTREEAEEADDALTSLGRAAMLLETHLPGPDARPSPGASRFAEALEADTEQAVRDVRRRRALDWDRVEQALDEWSDNDDPVVRGAAELQTRALGELTAAVSRSPLEQDVEPTRQVRRVQREVEAEESGTTPAPALADRTPPPPEPDTPEAPADGGRTAGPTDDRAADPTPDRPADAGAGGAAAARQAAPAGAGRRRRAADRSGRNPAATGERTPAPNRPADAGGDRPGTADGTGRRGADGAHGARDGDGGRDASRSRPAGEGRPD
ncbi:FUSC family protein [Streptomyces zhihengii]|uniref:FUSC family protein n=1 Tax=Streptomyces zhihengii TaxID=1818004 RepID=A0ABS2UMY6_9ACTN|nr:FUSC family protein [Streptomyces zhihengii]MBM9618423.1 FUSC family protein [Streptomyces zhihengii]